MSMPDKPHNDALVSAIKGNEAGKVATLLDKMDINTPLKDSFQRSALHIAAEQYVPAVMRVLLSKGADVNNRVDLLDRTPLHNSCRAGKLENTRQLLKHNAQVNVADKDGDTPLHLAAINGFTDICLRLLEHGARTDMTNAANKTAIQLAQAHGYAETAAAIRQAVSLRNSRRIKNLHAKKRGL